VWKARAEIAPGFFHGTFATAPGATPHLNFDRLTLFLPVIYRDGCGWVRALISGSSVSVSNALAAGFPVIFPLRPVVFSCSACYFRRISRFHIDFLTDFRFTRPPFTRIYRDRSRLRRRLVTKGRGTAHRGRLNALARCPRQSPWHWSASAGEVKELRSAGNVFAGEAPAPLRSEN
jgi:hypothetical protein